MDYVIVAGLALGAVYALTAMVYNTMFSTSKVLSFGAGQFAMVGGISCAWIMLSLHQPLWEAFIVVIVVGALFGAITELVAVRRVLDGSDNHLWVLTTLALATNVGNAGRVLHVVVEADDVQLLELRGVERLNRDRHRLEVLGTLLRGHHDFVEAGNRSGIGTIGGLHASE